MSHSGSHTPTNNPPVAQATTPPHPPVTPPHPPVTPPSLGPQIAESSSQRRVTPPDNPSMAKRIRRESPETRTRSSRHRSSSSFDSQDEMAVEKPKRPEPSAPTATPPKKKRTRTLTTPQQSAVLHALLAKSRFPTTAMREDVGRSIGLSARKVQIWFQNQRQKARRPRSQSDVSLTRPPQYGPFPNAPSSSSSARFEEYPAAHMSYTSQYLTPEPRPRQPDPPARLLGPGMPGPAVHPPHHTYPPIAGSSTSTAPIQPRYTPRTSESPPYYRSPHEPFHTSVTYPTSQPSHRYQRERDPMRTLPPLVPSSSYSTRRTHTSSSSMPSRPLHGLISPESGFLRVSPEINTRPSTSLPPPFSMHPSPLWNPPPLLSPWSRRDPQSSIDRSIPALTARHEHTMGSDPPEGGYHHSRSSSSHFTPPSPSVPPSRPGRYDPVRATFITRSSPPVSRIRSPEQQSSEEETHGDPKPPVSPKEDR